MGNADDAPVAGDRATPDKSPADSGANESTLSSDAARAVSDQRAMSQHDLARQQRALRRAYHNPRLPSWVKYIPGVVFPVYGIMRLADPNYESHFAKWQEEQRGNYSEGGSR